MTPSARRADHSDRQILAAPVVSGNAFRVDSNGLTAAVEGDLMRCRFIRLLAMGCLAGCALAPALALAAPITADYFENFNSYATGNTAVNNFSETNTAAYTIVQGSVGDNQYRGVFTSTSGGASGSAAVEVTNVVGASFRVRTDMTLAALTSASGATTNLGMGLFGTVADFSNTTSPNSQYRLLYTTFGSNAGKLTLTRGSATTGLTGTLSSTGTLAVEVGKLLTLTADVSYSGSTLNIAGTLTDGITTITINAQDASPLTGQFFGYRTAINSTGGTVSETADYDNFEITIPEPGSVGLLLACGLVSLSRRRR